MPELPDVEVYCERLTALFGGQPLQAARLKSPFLVRTVEPPLSAAVGRTLKSVTRLGKRLVFEFDPELYLVFHLMIAGRFHLKPLGASPGKLGLLALDFPSKTVMLTEASPKKRASLRVFSDLHGVEQQNAGGIEPLASDLAQFRAALLEENHTLKRSLTDPHLFSGIGNAYSDEILFVAQLSPLKRSFDMQPDESERLYRATRKVLTDFTSRIRKEVGEGFPEKVTAFREDMAVHGRFRKPCPVCESPIQRIVYAENEANYCAKCQTGGKLLSDRALSRLLKGDFPKTLEELEERRQANTALR
ncbi:MAG TPA: DNA-formamidopyrimidine glycosylase family protein [Polyangiaceae bacterium]|nr:DNA-formamidopyrimidine glycosylase family protein [Polyangiaceae bacterium]